MRRVRRSCRSQPQAPSEDLTQIAGAHASAPTDPEASTTTPLGGVVARLTGLNGLLLLLALVTGPVQARVLGPDGRGEIAIILTVLAVTPLVLDFGLSEFVARERARGASLGTLLGTALPLVIGFALIGVVLAVPFSELLSQGRPPVERYVRITMFAMPLWALGWMLLGAARGEQRWSILYRQRGLTVILSSTAIIGLALIGHLTVQTLAVAMLAVTVPGIAVALPVLRNVGPWRFDRALVRPALAFGSRSWVTLVSSQGTYRLDQIVMAVVVSSRELGLYAVSVAFTSVLSSFVSAVSVALMPRVAQQGGASVPRIVRISTLALASGLSVVLASSPFVMPLLFGAAFVATVPLVSVLVVGALCIGVSNILGSALQGHGRPQDAMRPQLLGLLVTIVGLAIALDPLGALGAALVSVVAYAVVLTGVTRAAAREFKCSPVALLLPRTEDLRWVIHMARRRVRRG